MLSFVRSSTYKLAAPRQAFFWASICRANTESPRSSRKSGYGLLLGCRSELDAGRFVVKKKFGRCWNQKNGKIFTVSLFGSGIAIDRAWST